MQLRPPALRTGEEQRHEDAEQDERRGQVRGSPHVGLPQLAAEIVARFGAYALAEGRRPTQQPASGQPALAGQQERGGERRAGDKRADDMRIRVQRPAPGTENTQCMASVRPAVVTRFTSRAASRLSSFGLAEFQYQAVRAAPYLRVVHGRKARILRVAEG